MSRLIRVVDETARGFPRVSGDEPMAFGIATVFTAFSPRERG